MEKLKETPYWSILYLVKRFLDVSCNFWNHSIEFLPSSWRTACGKWWVGDGLDWWHQCHFYGERDTFPDVNCVGCTALFNSLLVDQAVAAAPSARTTASEVRWRRATCCWVKDSARLAATKSMGNWSQGVEWPMKHEDSFANVRFHVNFQIEIASPVITS